MKIDPNKAFFIIFSIFYTALKFVTCLTQTYITGIDFTKV